MNINLNTQEIKRAVSKVLKGAGNNNLIYMTTLLGIEKIADKLILKSTDGNNHIHININIENSIDDFKITVPIDTFSKLINKMTCKTTEFILDNNTLIIKGNGTYNIKLPVNGEGRIAQFINYNFNANNIEITKINTKLLIDILTVNKPACAETLERPYLTGYYFGDKAISTDGVKASIYDLNIFNKPILFTSDILDIIKIIDDEEIQIEYNNEQVKIRTDTITIFSQQIDNKDSYPTNDTLSLVDIPFKSNIKVDKKLFLEALDRLNLFVEVYDANSVKLLFLNDCLTIINQKSTAQEIIPYIDEVNADIFECITDINMIINNVKVLNDTNINIHYGQTSCIKFVSNKIIKIIATAN